MQIRWPRHFAVNRVEVSGPDGGPIETLNRFEVDLRVPPAERTLLP